MKKRPLLLITGPTGLGKSALALRLAEEMQMKLLSVDSMLVYRGMDIGTAKPNQAEQQRVEHTLIDVAEPTEAYDVSRYLKDVERQVLSREESFIGVGGTPFYIKALKEGITQLRENPELEALLESYSTEKLRSILDQLDPLRSKAILGEDRFRLVRALVITMTHGIKASEIQQKVAAHQLPLDVVIVELTASKAFVHQRIQERLEKMFQAGLLDEARELYDLPLSRTARAAVGYKELYDYFDSKMSLEEAKERILIHTRRLHKHQMTWFKKWTTHRFDIEDIGEEKVCANFKELAQRMY